MRKHYRKNSVTFYNFQIFPGFRSLAKNSSLPSKSKQQFILVRISARYQILY